MLEKNITNFFNACKQYHFSAKSLESFSLRMLFTPVEVPASTVETTEKANIRINSRSEFLYQNCWVCPGNDFVHSVK